MVALWWGYWLIGVCGAVLAWWAIHREMRRAAAKHEAERHHVELERDDLATRLQTAEQELAKHKQRITELQAKRAAQVQNVWAFAKRGADAAHEALAKVASDAQAAEQAAAALRASSEERNRTHRELLNQLSAFGPLRDALHAKQIEVRTLSDRLRWNEAMRVTPHASAALTVNLGHARRALKSEANGNAAHPISSDRFLISVVGNADDLEEELKQAKQSLLVELEQLRARINLLESILSSPTKGIPVEAVSSEGKGNGSADESLEL